MIHCYQMPICSKGCDNLTLVFKDFAANYCWAKSAYFQKEFLKPSDTQKVLMAVADRNGSDLVSKNDGFGFPLEIINYRRKFP